MSNSLTPSLTDYLAASNAVYNEADPPNGVEQGVQQVVAPSEAALISDEQGALFQEGVTNLTPLAVDYIPSDGFYGTAFQTANSQIIVAFEGTLTNISSYGLSTIKDDIELHGGKLPASFTDAETFASSELNQAASLGIMPGNVFVTGHSLGGSEAEYAALTLSLPGAEFGGTGIPGYTGKPTDHSNFTSYVNNGDPVANFGSDTPLGQAQGIVSQNHVGNVVLLGGISDDSKIISDISSNNISKMLYDEASAVFEYHFLKNYSILLQGSIKTSLDPADLSSAFPGINNTTISTDTTGDLLQTGFLSTNTAQGVVQTSVQVTTFLNGNVQLNESATSGASTISVESVVNSSGSPVSDQVTANQAQVTIAGGDNVGLAVGTDGSIVVPVESSSNVDAIELVSEPNGSTNLIVCTASTSANVEALAPSIVQGQGPNISLDVTASGQAAITTQVAGGTKLEVTAESTANGVTQSYRLQTGSTLQLDQPSSFSGIITGFSPGSLIDLNDQGSTAPDTIGSLNQNNMLSFQSTSGSYSLQLDPTQNFRDSSFIAAPDANGGTDVRVASLVGVNGSGEIVAVDPGTGVTTPLSTSEIGPFAYGGEAAINGNFYVAGEYGLYTINVASGQVSSVASSTTNLVADSSNGTLLSVENQGVFAVNPSTGGTMLIAAVPGASSIALGGEAALDGNVYFASSGGKFYTVNEVSGATTSVSSNISNFVADDTTGKLVGVNNGNVYTVDKTTGVATSIAKVPGLSSVAVGGETAQGGDFYFSGVSATGTALYTVNILTGAVTSSASDVGNFVADQPVVCFVAGTRIRTARGDISIEKLGFGDRVVTASGEERLIKWLGHRKVNCRHQSRLHEVYPVCISANAFGENRPMRDLFVSPGHSICIDMLGEVLVPAAVLVNGSTIQQIEVDEVTYWHVELDSHDILMAENLACESYLEMGNRVFFAEGDVVAVAAAPDGNHALLTHADFCRPFHESGVIVMAIRAQLRRRACDLGWRLSEALSFHLEVDGRRVEPVIRGLVARFQLPASANEVWLVSPTTRPCDTLGTEDARSLGVRVIRIHIEDGFTPPRDIAITHPLLCVGFHALEDGICRWTAGRARLPAALWDGCRDGFYLRVELGAPPVPRWRRPDTTCIEHELMGIHV